MVAVSDVIVCTCGAVVAVKVVAMIVVVEICVPKEVVLVILSVDPSPLRFCVRQDHHNGNGYHRQCY